MAKEKEKNDDFDDDIDLPEDDPNDEPAEDAEDEELEDDEADDEEDPELESRVERKAAPPAPVADEIDTELAALEKDIEDADVALAAGGKLKKLFDRQNKIVKITNDRLKEVQPAARQAEQEMRWKNFESDAGMEEAPRDMRQQYSRKAMGKVIGDEFKLLMDTGRYNEQTAHLLATDRAARRIRNEVRRAVRDAAEGEDASRKVAKKITPRPAGARLSPPGGNSSRTVQKEVDPEAEFNESVGSLQTYDPSR